MERGNKILKNGKRKMMIKDGTGAPARVFAILPHFKDP